MIAIDAIATLANTAINKIWPNPEDKAKAECIIMTAELEKMKTEMSVMLAEAQSTDPYTSRARPSFLYVVYTMILFAIPMGLISAISPEVANHVSEGALAWLGKIPDKMYDLFMYCMLGYQASRTVEKVKGVA